MDHIWEMINTLPYLTKRGIPYDVYRCAREGCPVTAKKFLHQPITRDAQFNAERFEECDPGETSKEVADLC